MTERENTLSSNKKTITKRGRERTRSKGGRLFQRQSRCLRESPASARAAPPASGVRFVEAKADACT